MKKSYIFLATGFEEVEALATADVLRRGGMDVTLVSIYDTPYVTGAHGITVKADTTFAEADFAGADWLIAPGGMPGASNLAAFTPLTDMLVKHYQAGGNVAAICAAPAVVLAPLGIIDGRDATCYPGFEDALKAGNANHKAVRVVVDGNVITGNGPSSAIPFAAAIVAQSQGYDVAAQVTQGMLC